MEEVVRAIDVALRSAGTQYVVIGGIPASFWGKVRVTLDVDVVILASPQVVPSLLLVLERAGFAVPKTAAPRLSRGLAVKLKHGGLSADLRIASYSLDKSALERAVTVPVLGTKVPLSSPEDTVVYKLVRFSDQDRADIRWIVLRRARKLDTTYMTQAAQQLVAESGKQEILQNLATVLSWLTDAASRQ